MKSHPRNQRRVKVFKYVWHPREFLLVFSQLKRLVLIFNKYMRKLKRGKIQNMGLPDIITGLLLEG